MKGVRSYNWQPPAIQNSQEIGSLLARHVDGLKIIFMIGGCSLFWEKQDSDVAILPTFV